MKIANSLALQSVIISMGQPFFDCFLHQAISSGIDHFQNFWRRKTAASNLIQAA